LPADAQIYGLELERRVLAACKDAVMACKGSALVDTADLRDLQFAVKSVRSALELKRYVYSEAEAIHDEGTVLGFRPPSQDERAMAPGDAQTSARHSFGTIRRVLELADDDERARTGETAEPGRGTYRPNTAFVMMWMDPKEPELEDIRDTVRAVFEAFGIKAVRADDVEHEGMITDRIINEIKTSEFLLADLTGGRPSVYYEVGYAHALGKRVILYRKEGTQIHFDLAGYNCPEYRNLRDLRAKLTKRLEQLTNRKPKE
jgi:hypothetical protein